MRDHVRQLSAGVAIYGAGDAAISVVNFLLLPAYIRFLTRDDYGALLILISIETFVLPTTAALLLGFGVTLCIWYVLNRSHPA